MNSTNVGAPELITILFIVLMTGVIPVAVAIWAVATVRKVRAGQKELELKLETIERLIHRP